MKCPVCKTETLGSITLVENLRFSRPFRRSLREDAVTGCHILGCERAYARSHPKIWVSITGNPKEPNLPAHQCSKCGGIFVPSNAYLIWKRSLGENLPERTSASTIDPDWDADTLKLCPNCGHIMRRYKVLPESSLFLDRCGNCNGVWLDKNEWNALVERNLHDNLNEFFTRPWQDHLHAEETKNQMERIYLQKLGKEDYERIQEVRSWFRSNRNSAMLLAFLQADDPYEV